MPYPFITTEEIRQRIGPVPIRRIYDDLELGQEDEAPLERLAKDASAKVASAIRAARIYSLEKIKELDESPEEVIRLSLDVAHYYAAMRHPEVLQMDFAAMGQVIERELKALVDGKMMLDAPLEDVTPDEDDETPMAGGAPYMESDCRRGW